MVNVMPPSGPMCTKALGENTPSPACASRPASGSRRLSMKPPPAAAPACRKPRRERPVMDAGPEAAPASGRRARVMSASLPVRLRGLLDGLADPQIGPAAADVAGHRTVDVGVGRMRVLGEQRRRRHDLAGLAVAALRH